MEDLEIIVRAKLAYDDEFAIKCLLVLYERQEEDEQAVESAMHRNGAGFNKTDAPILTPLAQLVLDEQLIEAAGMLELHQRMPKYAGQLCRTLKEEELL